MKNILIILLAFVTNLNAATYLCTANYQSHMGKLITDSDSDFVRKHKPYTKVIEGSRIVVQRCSLPLLPTSAPCDTYEVDKIEYDSNVQIRKYYIFKSQYDIQIFSDMTYVENNGRGGLLIGSCKISQ